MTTTIDCVACLLPFESGNTAATLPCGHHLHEDCIYRIISASQQSCCDGSVIDPALTGEVAEVARRTLQDERTQVACPIDRAPFSNYLVLPNLPRAQQDPDFNILQHLDSPNFRNVASESNIRDGIPSPTATEPSMSTSALLSFYAIFAAIVGILWVILNGLCEVIRSDADVF